MATLYALPASALVEYFLKIELLTPFVWLAAKFLK
jgi:hypothetical protein